MTINIKNPAAFDAPARAARAALDMLDTRKAAALAAGRFNGHLLSEVLPRVTRSKLLESLHADGVAESICTFDVLAGERATTHDGMWELVKRWGGSETGIVSADITTDGVVTAVYQHGDRADATAAASLRASEALRNAQLDAHVVARKEFCVVSHGVVELHFSFVDGRLVTDPAPPADVLSETYTIENTTSGHILGDYEGETREHAIAAMLRDAGYRADVVDGDVETDCPNWNGGNDLAATERTTVSYEIVSAKPNGHVGERILFSTRERADDELVRLAAAFGCDAGDLCIVERAEAPDAGF